ncbi:MAG TPA: FAD-binding oxidoreductase [Candidatus Limnocylindrales bacterium]|nr:FAD-binding oxidoreductase [Candidatus Limnocylindrales bacterium]
MAAAPTPLSPDAIDQLRRTITAEVIGPQDPAYDEARRLWNAIHDLRPAVIARPQTAQEVATAIAFGRDHDLEIAVRSGGHSPAGHSGVDGGLVIDMSAMRDVAVDPVARTARTGGGALLGQLDVEAQAHGLVCPVGVVGHTGVAGLTLGGGVGRLQRNFGLTLDNVRVVELVTADGRVVRASETEEPELFWGMRGAGWNFGIVTGFELGLHPFGPELNRGILIYPGSDVRGAWQTFRDYALVAPDTVSLIFGIDRAGPTVNIPEELKGRPIAYISYNHSGAGETVDRDIAPLRAGPTPASETTGPANYLEVQTAHDLVFAGGQRSFLLGANADGLRLEALDELVELIGDAEGSFSATAMGGAIGRVAEDATAFAGRAAAFDLSVDATWDDPSRDEANRDWVRRAMAVLEPDTTLGRYANETADVGPDQTRLIYGDAKLSRLADLKRTWDPDNVFHLNHNVSPAAKQRSVDAIDG